MNRREMIRATFMIAVAFLCVTAAATPPGTVVSPCECRDNHGSVIALQIARRFMIESLR
jgi:hypothetical protein